MKLILLMRALDLFRISGFVDFRDYFGLFSTFFAGVIYEVDITPAKKVENRLKRTRKSTEPEFRKRSTLDSTDIQPVNSQKLPNFVPDSLPLPHGFQRRKRSGTHTACLFQEILELILQRSGHDLLDAVFVVHQKIGARDHDSQSWTK
jgi:hypothetical protein